MRSSSRIWIYADFKFIFFFEWGHRLLGRLIGAAMAVPLIFFWAKGFLPSGFKLKLLGVLALGALQGFVGWWMVKSGLTERVEVAQERLAIHLLLASLTFAALVWLAASLKDRACRNPRTEIAGAAAVCQWRGLARPFANRTRRLGRWLARRARVQYMAADRRIFLAASR